MNARSGELAVRRSEASVSSSAEDEASGAAEAHWRKRFPSTLFDHRKNAIKICVADRAFVKAELGDETIALRMLREWLSLNPNDTNAATLKRQIESSRN